MRDDVKSTTGRTLFGTITSCVASWLRLSMLRRAFTLDGTGWPKPERAQCITVQESAESQENRLSLTMREMLRCLPLLAFIPFTGHEGSKLGVVVAFSDMLVADTTKACATVLEYACLTLLRVESQTISEAYVATIGNG
eukprot:6489664-Amphidinium_carterae.1